MNESLKYENQRLNEKVDELQIKLMQDNELFEDTFNE
jgi:hypothetical protein